MAIEDYLRRKRRRPAMCPDCRGVGRVRVASSGHARVEVRERICPSCDGAGEIDLNEPRQWPNDTLPT